MRSPDGCLVKPAWLETEGDSVTCDPNHPHYATKPISSADAGCDPVASHPWMAAWFIRRHVINTTLVLLLAIMISVFMVLSITAVDKPNKTGDEQADDEDARRRGAYIGRRKVGASRYRFVNRKLAKWHAYANWLMAVALTCMAVGILSTIGCIQDAMRVKSPSEYHRDACQDQGWYEAVEPTTGRLL